MCRWDPGALSLYQSLFSWILLPHTRVNSPNPPIYLSLLRLICVDFTLDARGLLVRQRQGASERVVLVGERPLAQAVKSFERADPITLPLISPESKIFDPGNLIGWFKKRFLKGLLLVKCVMILAKLVLPKCENKRLRMSIKGNRRRHGSEVVIHWCQRFFSRRFTTQLRRSILSPLTRKKPLAPRVCRFKLADLIFLYFWVAIPSFLSLDNIFNKLASFVKNGTLLYSQAPWFIYSILE